MSESDSQQAADAEEQLRAAYEAELARIDAGEMILQAAVSLLNLGALRLAPGGEQGPPQDLEQAREAIDAVRGLLDVLERRRPQDVQRLRGALSQLQMAYAREADAAKAPPDGGEGDNGGESGSAEPDAKSDGPGPAQASGRLWVPGT